MMGIKVYIALLRTKCKTIPYVNIERRRSRVLHILALPYLEDWSVCLSKGLSVAASSARGVKEDLILPLKNRLELPVLTTHDIEIVSLPYTESPQADSALLALSQAHKPSRQKSHASHEPETSCSKACAALISYS